MLLYLACWSKLEENYKTSQINSTISPGVQPSSGLWMLPHNFMMFPLLHNFSKWLFQMPLSIVSDSEHSILLYSSQYYNPGENKDLVLISWGGWFPYTCWLNSSQILSECLPEQGEKSCGYFLHTLIVTRPGTGFPYVYL